MRRMSARGVTVLICLTLLSACAQSGDDGESAGTTGDPEQVTYTWYRDMAPLVTGSCVGCHTEGGIGPFSLETYDAAAPLAAFMSDVVASKTMPPWGAESTDECQPTHGFKNDISLTDEEIEMFRVWAEEGAPEGDPEDAAPLPEPVDLNLTTADANVFMDQALSIGGTQDQFLCVSLDPALTRDEYITGLQIVPGNDKVVHHVLVYKDPEGASAGLGGAEGFWDCGQSSGVDNTPLIGAWAPGSVPSVTPPGVGFLLEKESRIILNIHYHPTGNSTEEDTTGIQLDYADGLITKVAEMHLIGNFEAPMDTGDGLLPGPGDPADGPAFMIPAGAKDHVEEMTYIVQPEDGVPDAGVAVWSVGTHMHYVGTDMKMSVERAAPQAGEPAEECLVQTPRWDFNWQRGYDYDAAWEDYPRVRTGDTLRFRCIYDNSLDNPFVVEALAQQGLSEPQDVWLGEETLDEMCLGVVAVAVDLSGG